MLRFLSQPTCPSCTIDLVHEADNDVAGATRDRRWRCPVCGFSRPVVYAVERPRRGRGMMSGIGRR